MQEKKVVSIEDRIPKLKQIRKKKANRRLIQYLSILFLLIAVVVYLQSPLSHVNEVKVEGGTFVSSAEIEELSEIESNTNIWQVEAGAVEDRVSTHPQVMSVDVKRSLPSTIVVEIEEAERIGYIQTEGQFQPILENGALIDATTQLPGGDAPILKEFSDSSYLEEMSKQLKEVPDSISRLISEIHYTPDEDNPYLITLYMNDGYEVQASIRTFSEKITAYPSITSQIEEGERGIIHIDVGAYFEAYPKSEDESEDGEDESDPIGEETEESESIIEDEGGVVEDENEG
ncbi:FtsQ-type POTRA domain-containing protein [Halobacillus sp. A1]|uniref:cell division protein FtsQ/DivIB n=1 Tax=Halobacillus sp. A1 TaxID=2880262 RepID=UPI0020A6A100|nr:FtsQ-type POTRA domain-containing protein [Halobacillus sp. A1]MCP3031106.1 FtsQ-type POTRA domain-containing protein [Halobacillus sp. A1]